MIQVEYGKVEMITPMDDDGSTVVRSSTLHEGIEKDVKVRYEIRVRVESETEVLTEFLKFRDETKDKAKAEFRIEHTNAANLQGFFYIVKCWTELDTKVNIR